MIYEYVSVAKQNKTAIVTMNRPPLNVFNSEVYSELDDVFYKLGQDKEVSVIILTSEGDRFFCAGSDVKEFIDLNSETGIRYTLRNIGIRFNVYRCPKPVICALNGSALGGGLGLAMLCDFRIAHDKTEYSMGEINMGILGFTQFFTARLRNGTARKMIYTGMKIDAAEALQVGIIDEIVPEDEVMNRALELAEVLAKKPPVALRKAKECMLKAEESVLAGQEFENEVVKELWGGKEKTEAVKAFVEKRKPDFSNL